MLAASPSSALLSSRKLVHAFTCSRIFEEDPPAKQTDEGGTQESVVITSSCKTSCLLGLDMVGVQLRLASICRASIRRFWRRWKGDLEFFIEERFCLDLVTKFMQRPNC